jgi:ribonuclease VapC
MIVDTSALVAILLGEHDAATFEEAIAAAPIRLISAVSRVELSIVMEGRKGEAARRDVERLIAVGGFEIVPVTPQQALLAIEAFRTFGKGRHPAGLNIGDCFSYALARATGHKLLFKGQDFARTDIPSAMTS